MDMNNDTEVKELGSNCKYQVWINMMLNNNTERCKNLDVINDANSDDEKKNDRHMIYCDTYDCRHVWCSSKAVD